MASSRITRSCLGDDAETSTRDNMRALPIAVRYALVYRAGRLLRDRKPRRLLHRVKRKLSKWLSRQRVLIFRSINRRRA